MQYKFIYFSTHCPLASAQLFHKNYFHRPSMAVLLLNWGPLFGFISIALLAAFAVSDHIFLTETLFPFASVFFSTSLTIPHLPTLLYSTYKMRISKEHRFPLTQTDKRNLTPSHQETRSLLHSLLTFCCSKKAHMSLLCLLRPFNPFRSFI